VPLAGSVAGVRMSKLLLRTQREAPADADAESHRLLIRAGCIRRLASGIYCYLPYGLRALSRIIALVRAEMDAVGAQEILLPVLQPVELWQASGRLALLDEGLPAMRVTGRSGAYVLGPTHEEVATVTVGAEIESYRDLPRTVYQVQTKVRDEPRPRYGLLRTREFMMKDAYSFDASADAMAESYLAMFAAYGRIFDRLELPYLAVEASSGAIGGGVNHEWMVPSAIGEDAVARCGSCDYAANLEVAQAGERAGTDAGTTTGDDAELLAEHHTPDRPGIDLVVEYFAGRGLTAAGMLKCLAVMDDVGHPTVVLVPGDRDVRLPPGWSPFTDEDFSRHSNLVRGYIGPMGLSSTGIRVLADHALRRSQSWVTGANRADHHVTGARMGRDFTVDEWGSYATVADGDPCPRCPGRLELLRAVEAAHTFQLGLAYSARLPGASFLDESGTSKPLWMGCYGIGISRLLAVIAECHHDEQGLCWPVSVAPYRVHLMALGGGRHPEVAAAANQLYARLGEAGVETLYDDRGGSPGVSFADADLLGLPHQLIVGPKSLARGVVEYKDRRTGDRRELPLESDLMATLRAP
jgi:prolyl-tRNA synthetase